jgi:hypothetical protein
MDQDLMMHQQTKGQQVWVAMLFVSYELLLCVVAALQNRVYGGDRLLNLDDLCHHHQIPVV